MDIEGGEPAATGAEGQGAGVHILRLCAADHPGYVRRIASRGRPVKKLRRRAPAR
jgi:hypothetical protein